MPKALQFEGIGKEYRPLFGRRIVAALKNFSLDVECGEVFGFLGPNGAGKTTAIHLAMGFMRPTQGRGWMLGRPFGDAKTRERVGFLAENVALYHRPAEQLVGFYGALNGMTRGQSKRRARETLEAVGLLPEGRRNVSRFSRGMQQRVGLAQALVNDPELLILDEPTSALDPLARVAVRELLIAARNAGKTVFLSSHLLSEVELICDRVGVLNKGKLVRVGKTSDLLQSRAEYDITARAIPEGSFPEAKTVDGAVHLRIPSSRQRMVLEQIWAMGGEVLSVNPLRRSLEQIFLELTSDQSSNPGSEEHR